VNAKSDIDVTVVADRFVHQAADSIFKQPIRLRSRHCERQRSNPFRRAKKDWIASSRSLSSGAHSRDPLAPLRKRFAFVAGNDVGIQLRDLAAGYARVLP
jgi:hypothetical protein